MELSMTCTIEEILSTMRTKRFALEVLNAVESTAGYHFYSLYKLGGAKTVREWGELAEDDPSQRTSQITVRVCHDFEYAIANVLTEQYGYDIVPKNQTEGIDGNFDVAVKKNGTVLAFEVKTTQSSNGWTGSTHSHNCGKVPFYVLIQYELNMDIELGGQDLYGLFKSCHFSVTSPVEDGSAIIQWMGQATDSNSRTTGKIRKGDSELYSTMICLGDVSVERCRKWTKTTKESLDQYRTSHGSSALNPDFILQRIKIDPVTVELTKLLPTSDNELTVNMLNKFPARVFPESEEVYLSLICNL
tara:strand:- start:729 stop:1634 length:906 start_codon:yes stop_codon:yes gene_type:complete